MDKLIEEKTIVVLNLIRTNIKADEALKLTQALVNITNAKIGLRHLELDIPTEKPTKTKGAVA